MTDRVSTFINPVTSERKSSNNVVKDKLNNCQTFVAGNIKNCVNEWVKLTNDTHVLETVKGCRIDLVQTPYQSLLPKPLSVSDQEAKIIDSEIETMIQKQVIVPSEHEEGEFVSGIFLRPKKEQGKFRIILNLKPFNKFVLSEHFKMDTINTCVELMSENCFMASIDLKDAYYSIPIDTRDQKYLKFIWKDKLYQYTCLPMGLACAPRKFVKLLKPVFAHLHARGFISSGYLDDTYIQGESYEACQINVIETIKLLTKLGFFVHTEKSVTDPCQKMEHLGFILNSKEMTVSLTEDKCNKLLEKITTIDHTERPTIRLVASAIGSMVSYTTGVEYGPLFYKQLEIEKTIALKQNMGNFDANMFVSKLAREDMSWWKVNAGKLPFHINKGNAKYVMCTDASTLGWGATLNGNKCGGRWTTTEQLDHINVLELRAVLFGLQSLCRDLHNVHLLIKSDNTTTVAYIRNMGGCKSAPCNIIARKIWNWALNNNNWLTATHIEGRLNTEPDNLSRLFDDHTEWMLNPVLFKDIVKVFNPTRDLFASRLNKQLDCYISWQPDPQATAVDAFSLFWGDKINYIFPPFAMLNRVLTKLEEDKAEGIVIAPLWTTQCWFPKLLHLLVDLPKTLPRGKRQLILPFNRDLVHPLWRKLQLLVCPLSGDSCKNKDFRRKLRTSFFSHGDRQPENNTTPICQNGKYIALEGAWIPLNPL